MIATTSSARAGLSLLEVALSLALLAATVLPLTFLMVRSRASVGQATHYHTARLAALSVLDQVRSQAKISQTAFGDLLGDWNVDNSASPFEAPLDASEAQGRFFTVPNLPSRDGGAPHGSLTFLLDERDIDLDGDPATTFPLDLDADGTLGTITTNSRYRGLPVVVEVVWGQGDEHRVRLTTIISQPANFRRQNES